MPSSACELRQVWVFYGRTPALRGVTLQVASGELVGVFGHNGAGKSTLLRTVLGLVPVQRGEVWVEGIAVRGKNLLPLRRRIGYVPQMLRVDTGVPVLAREVAAMGLYAQVGWVPFLTREHREAVQRALHAIDIAHLADKPFGHLSGGEQQRVLLARALAQSPRLLLMDEPTSSVDWQFVRELSALIRQVHRDNGLTTLVVSHDAPFLARLCDRVVVMESGAICADLPACKLLEHLERDWR
ncbi:MAG: ABC transporter ATP-binding protein [Armatimonadota bacterium]|nr:ABC transporter ATP-binding protein [Armatimonadota bacterium]